VNLLDILLVILIAASVATGFVAGFARVGIGFLATVVGLVFGFWFYGIPAATIHKYVSSEALSSIFGFLLVFLGCIAVGGLIAKLLSKLFKWTGLTWLDRLFGVAFGFVRGALIAVVFVAVLMAFVSKPLPNWMVDSKLLPYAVDASDVCASLAPQALKDAFEDGLHEIRKAWQDQLKKKKDHKPAKEAEV
jgi:membrane protein required for colicin V production